MTTLLISPYKSISLKHIGPLIAIRSTGSHGCPRRVFARLRMVAIFRIAVTGVKYDDFNRASEPQHRNSRVRTRPERRRIPLFTSVYLTEWLVRGSENLEIDGQEGLLGTPLKTPPPRICFQCFQCADLSQNEDTLRLPKYILRQVQHLLPLVVD
jgi:hypothetical protein